MGKPGTRNRKRERPCNFCGEFSKTCNLHRVHTSLLPTEHSRFTIRSSIRISENRRETNCPGCSSSLEDHHRQDRRPTCRESHCDLPQNRCSCSWCLPAYGPPRTFAGGAASSLQCTAHSWGRRPGELGSGTR
jgi:hypothetical protein